MNKRLFNLLTVLVFGLSAVMPAQAMFGRAARFFGRYAGAASRWAGQQALRAVQTSTRAPRKTRFNWQKTFQSKSNNNRMQRAKRYLPVAGVAAAGVTGITVALTNQVLAEEKKDVNDVVARFDELIKTRDGCWFIRNVLDENPQADVLQAITSLVIEHFDELLAMYNGFFLIEEVLEKNLQAGVPKAIVDVVVARMNVLFGTCDGRSLVRLVLRESPQVIIDASLARLSELLETWNGRFLLKEVLDKNLQADVTQEITDAVVARLDVLFGTYDGRQLVGKIFEKNTQADVAQEIADAVVARLDNLLGEYDGRQLVGEIFEKKTQAIIDVLIDRLDKLVKTDCGLAMKVLNKVPQLAVQHFAMLSQSKEGNFLLAGVLQAHPDVAQEFIQPAIQNFIVLFREWHGRDVLKKIMEIYPDAGQQFIVVARKMKAGDSNYDFITLLQMQDNNDFITLSRMQDKKNRGEKLSQTEAHMLANKREVLSHPYDYQELMVLQREIIQREHSLIDAGYVPFYHAQSKEKWFPIELYRWLHEIKTGKKLDEFYFMHTQANAVLKRVKKRLTGFESQDPLISAAQRLIVGERVKQHEETEEREKLVRRGRGSMQDRERMLFLNDSLRGNVTNGGSQSFPGYFVSSHNVGNLYAQQSSVLQDVFGYHGFLHCYKQFKDELKQLHEEYMQLSKYGTLYQIAVSRDNVDKTVAVAESGGYYKELTINGKKTRDMKKIVDSLRDTDHYPEESDEKEYAAMMTYDKYGLMNPKCGAKIFAYMIPTDEQKYQEWLAKWAKLAARIKEHIEGNRPADYVSPATTQEYVGLVNKAYQQVFGAEA